MSPLVSTRRITAIRSPPPTGAATVITYQAPSGRPVKEKWPAALHSARRAYLA